MDGNSYRPTVIRSTTIIQRKRIVNTEQDYQELKASLLRVVEMVKTDRALALELLVGTGMYTEDGELKEEYR